MSDKEVKIRITGDVSDIEKKVKSLSDKLENMGKEVSGKGINDMVDGLNKAVKVGENFADTVNDIANSSNKVDKKNGFSNIASDASKANKELSVTAENIKDLGKGITSIDTKKFESLYKPISEIAATSDDLEKVKKAIGGINGDVNISGSVNKIKNNTSSLGSELTSAFVSGTIAGNIMASTLGEVTSEIKDVVAALNSMDDSTGLKTKVHTFDKFAETIKNAREEIEAAEKKLSSLYNKLDNAKMDLNYYKEVEAEDDDIATQTKKITAFENKIQEVQGEIKGYTEELNKAKKALDELTAQEQKYINEFDDKLDKYNKLGGKIADVVNDEEQHVLVQKRLAQAYEQTSKSMENMSKEDVDYKEASKDLERLTKDAKEYMEAVSLMNFDNLNDDLKKLTKNISEKIEKTKELKEANSAMDDQTRATVYGLEKEAEALKEYADTAGYALKHVAKKADTDEEWQIVGNAKALEKAMNPEKIREYNKAITEYMRTINESNGQISSRFLNEDGSFSPAKYIADLERFGKPMTQLIANYKSLKQQALEYLKVGEEERQVLAQQAKERLDNAENAQKEAKALKEKAEAAHKENEASRDSIANVKKGIDAKLEEVNAYIKSAKALQEQGEATDESNKKLEESIKLQKELTDISRKMAVDLSEADKKATKSREELSEATEKLAKAEKDVAKAQDAVNRNDQEAAIKNAKARLRDVELTEKAAKVNLEYAQTAEKAAKAAHEEAEAQREKLSIMEQGTKLTEMSAKMSKELNEAVNKSLKTQKEYEDAVKKTVEAQEKLDKSTKDVADAKEKLERAEKSELDNKRDIVKQVLDEADALKKLGAAVEGINLDEIRDIDKTLGTKLKDLFPDDLPDSFKGWIDHIKAAFTELGDLEFGNFGSFMKDIGKGILDLIPGKVKAIIVVITALGTALKKCADIGVNQFNKGVDTISNTFSKIGSLARSFGNEVRTAFESITGTNIDLSSLMEIGPNFEYQMQKVGTIAGSNKRQLEELTKAAEHLGGTTMYSATQVGEAFEYMAMAGYDTEEMLSSIKGVLSLSIASGTDLAKTSDIVTDYMTAMGMSASNTSDFVDKLAATVTSANTTVELFGTSMKQVGSQAGSLGITMTDISTAIGLAANAGVKGSKAGTALKNVLANMASPTKKQAAALEKLGFKADKAGSYLITTSDGAVDLEANMKKLMTATEGMSRSERAAALTAIAGKEAMAGLFAIVNQGTDAWDELSSTIENSTGTVQYWNECMSLAGKSGDEATKTIDNMKKVFSETESEAIDLGLSTKDLSHAIAILGDDGDVTTQNVRDLISVIDNMNTASGEAEKQWRSLDKTGKNAINTNYDYDATIAKITADTTGLSQEKKKLIKEQLDENMTLEQANAVLEKYGMSAERVSFSTLTYAEKLGYLRDTLGETLDETEKTTLKNLGLGDSIDEISEVLAMSQTEFDAYTENLKTVKGMAEQMAEAFDEVTKGSLLNLASAIENVCIAAFNKIKPALKGATDAINDFFDTWHNGDQNVFTFDGLEKGLAGLESKLSQSAGKIKDAVVNLFSDLDRFINGGSLQSLLNMGTQIINSIAQGINEAKSNGTLDAAISGAIRSIGTWCSENLDTIVAVGKEIIDSISRGIEENSDVISDVIQSVIDMQTTIDGAVAFEKGRLFGENFGLFIGKGIESKLTEWVSSFGGFMSGLFPSNFTMEGDNGQEMMYIPDYTGMTGGTWVETGRKVGKEVGAGINQGAKEEIVNNKSLVASAVDDNFKEAKVKTGITSSEIGQEVSDNIMSKLETMDASQLAALGTELVNLQTTVEGVATGIGTSFTNIQEASRTSFMGLANIVRNQMLNCTNIVRNQAINMSNIFRNQFINMSNIVRNQAVNMANIIRNQCINMSNIFRNQFVNMANIARNQMVNVSNIVRNQAISWNNVIRNQVTNARNTFTSQFLSMAAVARTQMVNISNIVRNQAISWSNVIRNQTANMKASFTAAFSGLSSIAASQMAKCLSTVRSYMSQIRAATAQTMTMNFRVNRTITTTNVTRSVAQGAARTMSNLARAGSSLIAPQAVAIGGNLVGGSGRQNNGLGNANALQLSIPLTVDGREIARATASYNQEELSKLSKRNNRRRGE